MYATTVWEGVEHPLARGHNHRCHYCGQFIDDGEEALFCRLARLTTYAVHIGEADIADANGVTMRQKFEAWARTA